MGALASLRLRPQGNTPLSKLFYAVHPETCRLRSLGYTLVRMSSNVVWGRGL
jgi:hypothetical protein